MPKAHHRTLAIAVAALFLAALSGCNEPRIVSDKDIRYVSLAEVRALAQPERLSTSNVILFDARSKRAYAEEHIPGAENLLIANVNVDLDRDPRIRQADHVIVYADNPGSSPAKALAKKLMMLRYKDIYVYQGGIEEWRASGLPTASLEPADAPTSAASNQPASNQPAPTPPAP